MKQTLLFLLVSIGGLSAVACKNYFGNPYKHPLPPRVVPASGGELRVEPANWWTGMLHNRVELLVRYPSIGAFEVNMPNARGISLEKVEKSDNPNYLFLTLNIAADAPAQRAAIHFMHPQSGETFVHEFPVLQRAPSLKAQGLDSRDVVYMIFPDRFANGDPSNDRVAGMLDTAGRFSRDGRHGGDLKGILDHLDYLQDLGITAVWLNPELENDQARTSYHGYAVTDMYRIDRRMGTNEQYRELVRQCHNRGIKVVRDVIPNHIGVNHYWMKDLPAGDWVNTWPAYTQTSFRAPVLLDPYASATEKKIFSDGWFAPSMPDLNQRNPHLANYLIQQAIWWVEYAGLDAYRIDTYPYSDQAFMSRWCRALREEYPSIHLFGEVWEHAVVVQGYFADDQPMARAGFDSNLPGVVDFQLCFALQDALTKEPGWTEGVARIYYTLAQDYFYKDPMKNVVMLDNHDMTRFFSVVGSDMNKFKSGLAFLLTTRGIPQIYYGTEILSAGQKSDGDDVLRKEFPGGWPGDRENKFTPGGRTAAENEAFHYVRTLIRYRNSTTALQTGKLMQFMPADGVYVYFRYDDAQTVMVVLNTADTDKTLDTGRFAERLTGFNRATEVVSGRILTDISKLTLEKHAPLVLELMR